MVRSSAKDQLGQVHGVGAAFPGARYADVVVAGDAPGDMQGGVIPQAGRPRFRRERGQVVWQIRAEIPGRFPQVPCGGPMEQESAVVGLRVPGIRHLNGVGVHAPQALPGGVL